MIREAMVILWLLLCAVYNLMFFIFHLTFWKLLRWKVELNQVSSTNRAVMQTLNLCLTFIFLLASYLYFFHMDEMSTTSIGKAFSYGILLFWILRTALQFILFDLKKREHVILLVVFITGVLIHSAASFGL